MSDNTAEKVTVVGSVNGPRARVLHAIETGRLVDGQKLTMGNFASFAMEDDIDASDFGNAILDLLDMGEIHSQKGRNGGLKLGAKPAPNAKTASAALLASLRKQRAG